MANLKENPTLKDLQKFVAEICKERGFDKNSHLEEFLLFSEEVGELAKAIRNETKLYKEVGKSGKEHAKFELEEEFNDVLIYLVSLANKFEIDLEKAIRKKEKVNKKRAWAKKE
ncbi:MAG: RS21-C6 protein [Candidatus Liptonbacteria bacterium]|nr:RS21-C6 protein [Candidatus Liptonbacteria bacterium]